MKHTFHIALLSGHAPSKEGAEMKAGSLKGKGENAVAKAFLPDLANRLRKLGHTVDVTERKNSGGTSPLYSAFAANKTGADIAFEWHFNAYNEDSHGACVLHWATNKTAAKIAAHLARVMADTLGTDLHGNGLIPVHNNCPEERGYYAFKRSTMPFFMLEPCFAGSNPKEAAAYSEAITSGKWADAMAKAIDDALQMLMA